MPKELLTLLGTVTYMNDVTHRVPPLTVPLTANMKAEQPDGTSL